MKSTKAIKGTRRLGGAGQVVLSADRGSGFGKMKAPEMLLSAGSYMK